ncbi:MAG: penicillin-binding protein 1C [Xanthomonadales bacterium]|nr:penicillin-binding protein 1C [Xanthomonadales bacterium]
MRRLGSALTKTLRRRVITLFAAVLAPLLLAWLLDRCFPPPIPDLAQASSRVVLDRQGRPLRAFADPEGHWRYPVAQTQVAPDFLQALIRYEDHRYYQHAGIDPLALLRAAWLALRHGRVVSGGSTLTMQVARLLEDLPHTTGGKLRQMLRALQLEWRLDKSEILDLYLALAPYGGPIQGVEAASRSYLGKPASELSQAEAALLVVLPQAPSRLRPDRHPERARAARDKVLQRMVDLGVWSDAQVAAAQLEPVVARRLRAPLHAPLLARELASRSDASVIHSTIDLDWQLTIEERVGAYMDRLPPRTSAAVVVLDAPSGEVRVHVGSARFADPERLGHVDMTHAVRSPGSTLKPLLYGLALDAYLIHSESLLVDAPRELRGYRPGNFGGSFSGPVSATEALHRSLNVPAVDLLERIGPKTFAASLAHAGLPLALPEGESPNLSLILGGAGVRLLQLVGAYRALDGSGLAVLPRLQPEQPLQQRRLLSPGASWIVRRMITSDPFAAGSERLFVPDGSATLAWKTGTSYGFRDSWAVGLAGDLVIGVWIGRPDGTPVPGEYGAVTALPLLVQVAHSLPRRGQAPVRPESVQQQDICWPLGQAADPAWLALCQERRKAWVLDGVVPATLPDPSQQRWQAAAVRYWLDPLGQRRHSGCARNDMQEHRLARWPLRAEPWLGARQRQASALPALAADCSPDQLGAPSLLVRGLEPDSVLRSSEGPGAPVQLQLQALGNEDRTWWLLDRRLVGQTDGKSLLPLRLDRPGEHELIAVAADGRWRELTFRVR